MRLLWAGILNKHCPVKSIVVRKNYTPWMTTELTVASKTLQREQRKAKNNWSLEAQDQVKFLCEKLKDKLKHAEEQWRERE